MATRSIVAIRTNFEVEGKKAGKYNVDVKEGKVIIEAPDMPKRIKINPGEVAGIYVHFDGYPSGVGELLKFKSPLSVIYDVILGDASSLDVFASVYEAKHFGVIPQNVKDKKPCVKHGVGINCSMVSLHYHRDYGEKIKHRIGEHLNAQKFKNTYPDVEYFYMMDINYPSGLFLNFPRKLSVFSYRSQEHLVEWKWSPNLGWI